MVGWRHRIRDVCNNESDIKFLWRETRREYRKRGGVSTLVFERQAYLLPRMKPGREPVGVLGELVEHRESERKVIARSL